MRFTTCLIDPHFSFSRRYSGADGAGLRSHPFTGWSALVVNVMAQRFDDWGLDAE